MHATVAPSLLRESTECDVVCALQEVVKVRTWCWCFGLIPARMVLCISLWTLEHYYVVRLILVQVVFGICFTLKPGALPFKLQFIYLHCCGDIKGNVYEYVCLLICDRRIVVLFLMCIIYIRISVLCV